MGELERSIAELKLGASELHGDEARESAAAARRPCEELEEAYRQERAEHEETREMVIAVRVTAIVLSVLLIDSVFAWWLVMR